MVALTNTQKVRLLIGGSGTVTYLSDAEIGEFLTDTTNDILLTALYSVDAIIAAIGLKVTKKISDQSINYSDLQDHFIKLAERLRIKYDSYNYGTPSPTSGSEDVDARFESQQFDYE